MSKKASKESQFSFAPPSFRLGGGWGCDKGSKEEGRILAYFPIL